MRSLAGIALLLAPLAVAAQGSGPAVQACLVERTRRRVRDLR